MHPRPPTHLLSEIGRYSSSSSDRGQDIHGHSPILRCVFLLEESQRLSTQPSGRESCQRTQPVLRRVCACKSEMCSETCVKVASYSADKTKRPAHGPKGDTVFTLTPAAVNGSVSVCQWIQVALFWTELQRWKATTPSLSLQARPGQLYFSVFECVISGFSFFYKAISHFCRIGPYEWVDGSQGGAKTVYCVSSSAVSHWACKLNILLFLLHDVWRKLGFRFGRNIFT